MGWRSNGYTVPRYPSPDIPVPQSRTCYFDFAVAFGRTDRIVRSGFGSSRGWGRIHHRCLAQLCACGVRAHPGRDAARLRRVVGPHVAEGLHPVKSHPKHSTHFKLVAVAAPYQLVDQ